MINNHGFNWQMFSYDDDGNTLPSSQALYGPYLSLEDAVTDIKAQFGDKNIPLGLTIGVINQGEIEEYWTSDYQDCDASVFDEQSFKLKSVSHMLPIDEYGQTAITDGNISIVSASSIKLYVESKINALQLLNLATLDYVNNLISGFVTESYVTNAVNGLATEDYVADMLESKLDELSSGNNIKTINSQSILGSGNILIETNIDVATSTTDGLMSSTDKLKLDNFYHSVDKMLYRDMISMEDETELKKYTKRTYTGPLHWNIYDTSGYCGYMYMFGDSMGHGITQVFVSNFTEGNTHTDGVITTQYRYFGFTSPHDELNHKWSEWKDYAPDVEIPEATLTTSGLMSANDKLKLEAVSSNLTMMKMTQSDYNTAKSNGTLNDNILYVITNG